MKLAELRKIKSKENLWKQVTLSHKQIEEIESIYGKGCDTRWHQYYQYFTGEFHAEYLPEIIYSTKLEPMWNPKFVTSALCDKGLLEILYESIEGLYIPKTVILNSSGVYYNIDRNIVSLNDAVSIIHESLAKYGSLIIKPTLNSMSGRNVRILKEDCDIRELLKNEYKSDFIVQERMENQDDIKQLNPFSFNTLRVITYICDCNYYVAPLVLRIGGSKSHLDNAHAGGIFVGVDEDGTLLDEAFTEYGEKYKEHPVTHVEFKGYRIAGIDRVVRAAVECHKHTPHLKMISWDFSIDKAGRVILIESNQYGQAVWISQIAHGKPFFGENTLKILTENNCIRRE